VIFAWLRMGTAGALWNDAKQKGRLAAAFFLFHL
jgi:hypothetical protein